LLYVIGELSAIKDSFAGELSAIEDSFARDFLDFYLDESFGRLAAISLSYTGSLSFYISSIISSAY